MKLDISQNGTLNSIANCIDYVELVFVQLKLDHIKSFQLMKSIDGFNKNTKLCMYH